MCLGEAISIEERGRAPSWMLEQIEEDFHEVKKISLNQLDQTEKAVPPQRDLVRYRIAGNQLYYSKSWKPREFEAIDRFQKALLTLCQLAPLPDIDFIVNHEDGTATPFYLTQKREDQAPILGWAKLKSIPFLILIPDYRSVSTLWYNDIRKLVEGKNYSGSRLQWEEKKEIAFWRGVYSEPVHRLRISQLSNLFPDLLDAGLTAFENIAYVRPHASYEEHLHYKYLPVLDGIMCSYPGYQWRLLSTSLALKQESDQIQWFYRALQPYVHYLPIANDLSDLTEKIKWAREHDRECAMMAERARTFALENLMFDDIYLYLYLVLEEYASHQDESLKEEIAQTSENPAWQFL